MTSTIVIALAGTSGFLLGMSIKKEHRTVALATMTCLTLASSLLILWT